MRVRSKRCAQGRYSGLEAALFEFRQTQIELHARQLRIQSQCFPVGGGRFGVFLLAGKNDTQARKGCGILWILLGDRAPGFRGFFQLSRVL